MDEAKPFKIPKREVWEAFKRVKANQGAAGVDGQSIAAFEANLSGNLYKLWNRLSSGSYFPPPVRRVEIPKANGGTRPLGIPTVADRSRPGGRPSLPGAAFWSRCFMPTPTATDPANLQSMPCAKPVSAAGDTTGCSISMSKDTSTVSIGSCCSGGSSSYELPVGATLHRTLAEGSGADGGRQRRAAHGRNSAGRGRQPHSGESVSALCVRHMDGENLSSHSVRALRGRRHLSLQERRRGGGVKERTCRPLCGLQVGAASGEDENRLL